MVTAWTILKLFNFFLRPLLPVWIGLTVASKENIGKVLNIINANKATNKFIGVACVDP